MLLPPLSVAGSMVTITGVAAGMTNITVTATAMGDTATQTIAVTVIDVPGMPMNVEAEADSRTEITVTWEAAADNGSAITSYIVEQSYMGSFLDGDDIHNTGAGGESFAFSDHMEWWETLNCKGMLLAVGSDEMPAGEGEEKGADEMMYCAHFLNTAPTNIDDAMKELSDAAKDDVEMYFNMRYMVTDATTMTATFTDLGPGRAYMYRVKAANAVGTGMWSATANATTTENMAPAGDDITAMVTVDETEMVQSTIADPEGDALTWSVDHGDGMYATATVDDMGMVTITGVMAGEATITVTATDSFGAEGMQTITVTVEAAAPAEVMPPTGVMSTVDGNVVTITWGGGENAATFTVAMIRRDENNVWDVPNAVYDTGVTSSPHVVNMATRPVGSYHVFVVAGDGEGKWTDWVTGSVNYQP